MIILNTTLTPQEITIVPRELSATVMELTEEGQTDTLEINISPSIDRYFLKFSESFTLREGGKYTMRILNGTKEVYLDSIFCTDQEPEDYSINKGVYKESVTDNNLITY